MQAAEGALFPAGFEPTAPGLGIRCSIRLSYGNMANARGLRRETLSDPGAGRCQLVSGPG